MPGTYSLKDLSTHFLRTYRASQRTLNNQLPKPLLTLRQKAFHLFEQEGLPHQKKEAYRYTPLLKKLSRHLVQTIQKPIAASIEQIKPHSLHTLDAYHLTLHNGKLPPKHAVQVDHPDNLHILPLSTAYRLYPEMVKTYFAELALSEKESLVALNTLLFTQAYFLYLPPHTTLHKPLFIHYAMQDDLSATSYPRLLIVLGENSQLQLIETFHTPSQSAFFNRVAEIVLEPYARLDHYHLQPQYNPAALQMNYTYIYQKAASRSYHYTFTLAGQLVRNYLEVTLAEPHSQTHLYGIYKGDRPGHIENHIMVDHQAPYTTSHQLYKGLAASATTGVFRGGIYVRKPAQKTKASQKHHAWLLDAKAKVKTQPLLSIQADEVQCSHGVTVSYPDEEQLFYLSTRGFNKQEAHRLLLQGFCQEMINKINCPMLREYISQTLSSSEP